MPERLCVESTCPQHPFLLFNSIEETPGWKNRTVAPWKGWENAIISDTVLALRTGYSGYIYNSGYNWSNTGVTHTSNISYLNRADVRGYYTRVLGMAYQITKDTKYVIKAKEALVNSVEWATYEYDGAVEAYIRGHRAVALEDYLLAYDWIQPALTPEEDALIRDKLYTLTCQVYWDCTHYSGTSSGYPISFSYLAQHGQSYPALGIASAALYDYNNPNVQIVFGDTVKNTKSFHTVPATTPQMWFRAGKEYMFEHDLLHSTPTIPLWATEFDDNGRYLNGAYKSYFIDDVVLWLQVCNNFYGENMLETYPLVKKGLTEEIWASLPNHYSDNFCTNSEHKWTHHKLIAKFFADDEKAELLNHTDRTDATFILYYADETTGASQGGICNEYRYCMYDNYPSIQRKYPARRSKLTTNQKVISQLIRGSWADDADWLSLTATSIYSGSNRDMEHHDQLAFEYYSRGDLLLADGGEDKVSFVPSFGKKALYHNTVTFGDPRYPFVPYPENGLTSRSAYKGAEEGMQTAAIIDNAIETPWVDSVRGHLRSIGVPGFEGAIAKLALDMQYSVLYGSNNPLATSSLSSPIYYDRTIIYPRSDSASDYFIVIDRFSGTETWEYNTLFRPTNQIPVYSTYPATFSGTGHVVGSLSVGGQPIDWVSESVLPHFTETNTNITTNSIQWNVTNPYGKAVELNIFSSPAGNIKMNKHFTRVGGSAAYCEVFCPIVLFTHPATTELYRVTALLSRYTATETAKIATEIPVTGTGHALRIQTQISIDVAYAGNGIVSSFDQFTTDAEILFARVTSNSMEFTMYNGSYLRYFNQNTGQTEQWANLSEKVSDITVKKDSMVDYRMNGSQTVTGSVFGVTI